MGEIVHHLQLPIWVNCVYASIISQYIISIWYIIEYIKYKYSTSISSITLDFLIKQKQILGIGFPYCSSKTLGVVHSTHPSPVGWPASRLTPRRARCHCGCQCAPTSKAPRIRRPPRCLKRGQGWFRRALCRYPSPQKIYSTCPLKMQKESNSLPADHHVSGVVLC